MGMPEQANKDWRCVYALFSEYLPGPDFGRDGKWVKGACSDQNRFICEVKNTLFSRECDTGFQLFGDKCYYYRYFFQTRRIYREIYYKFSASSSSYQESELMCQKNFGADLIMLKSESEQKYFDEFYTSLNTPWGIWLGLSDHDNPGTMAWYDGDYVGYTNWAPGFFRNN